MSREYQKYVLYIEDCNVDCMTKNEVRTNVGTVLVLYWHDVIHKCL
jgi:hypothetical protein